MVDVPVIRFFQWNTAEVADPVGTRHIPGGSFAFLRNVSLGCGNYDSSNPGGTSGAMIFPGTTFTVEAGTPPPFLESTVTAITINLGSSGVAFSDLKLFISDDTALTIPAQSVGSDPAFVQFSTSGIWQPNAVWPSGIHERLSTTVPDNINVKRQDGAIGILQQDDQNSSEYIYMNLVIPFGFPIGDYGVCSSGALRFGLIFNYYNDEYVIQFGDPN
jgi:hypothetical protein